MFAPTATKSQMKAVSKSTTSPQLRHSIAGGKSVGPTSVVSPGVLQKGEIRSMSPALSRDFSHIPAFPPARENQHEILTSLGAFSSGNILQTKLVVADSNDVLERQADRVADQVMRMPDPALSITPGPTEVNRKCASCEDEDKTLHTKPTGSRRTMSDAPPIVMEVLRSSGTPLDTQTRAFFEPRFRSDFSHVRVHADEKAIQSARAVNALAYAAGPDIVFGAGAFSPQTASGKHLLAHELAHVVQQGAQGPWTSSTAAGGEPGEVHRWKAGRESPELGAPENAPVDPVAGAGYGSANARIMRTHLVTNDFKICHRILKGQSIFHVSQGGLVITANGRWERNEANEDSDDAQAPHAAEMPICGQQTYNVSLSDDGRVYDSEYGTCEFPMGRPASRQWTQLPEKDYYVKIWVEDHNPACCLEGDVEISQQAGLTGESCTRLPPGPLEILHDALTIAGMIPALGAVPDAINAGIYLVEGDWVNAGLSAAMVVPFLGEAAAVIKIGDKAALKISGEAIEKAGSKEIAAGFSKAKAAQGAKLAKDAEVAKAAIAGAEEIKLTKAEYEKALKMVFPSQYVDPVANLVDGLGQRAAKRAMENPRFVTALENGNMTLAGTFFHSAAAQEAKAIAPGMLPTGWILSAEETVKAGKGGSRIDVLLRGPAGEAVEFDWKTSGKSALSSGSRKEMVRHAGEITVKTGRTLTTQESRSWLDYVRALAQ